MKITGPFTYANGEQCTGHVVQVEAFKANQDMIDRLPKPGIAPGIEISFHVADFVVYRTRPSLS
jgi:hypothetical protein